MDEKPKLTRSGIKRIIVIYGSMVWTALLFFVAAGGIDLPRAWAYIIISLLLETAIFYVFLVRYPMLTELINARGEMKIEKGWDKLFALLYALSTLVLLPIVAGLDVGRFNWSYLGIWGLVVGLIFLVGAMLFSTWAMMVNIFFEPGVRIQKERGQEVIMTGPYAIVRHPGYASFIFLYFSFPLTVGSGYSLFVSLFIALLFIVRTALEDATLQKELEGYGEYTKKVRYRLIPFVW